MLFLFGFIPLATLKEKFAFTQLFLPQAISFFPSTFVFAHTDAFFSSLKVYKNPKTVRTLSVCHCSLIFNV